MKKITEATEKRIKKQIEKKVNALRMETIIKLEKMISEYGIEVINIYVGGIINDERK